MKETSIRYLFVFGLGSAVGVLSATCFFKAAAKSEMKTAQSDTHDAGAKESLLQEIRKELGNSSISAKFLRNSLFLEGTADSDFEADRAVEVARALLNIREDARKPSTSPSTNDRQSAVTLIDMIRVRPRKQ